MRYIYLFIYSTFLFSKAYNHLNVKTR